MCLRFELRTTLIMKRSYHGGRAKSRDVRCCSHPEGEAIRCALTDACGTGETDLPDGQISKNLSSPPLKNILLHGEGKSPAYLPPSRARTEGRWPSSRTLGAGCGGREVSLDERHFCGRRSRVVLTPRRWCQVPKKLTLPGGDGGKKARLTGESTK
jgi:hypothetical protein